MGDWLSLPVSGLDLDWFRQPVSAPSWLRVLADLVASPKTPTELAHLENKHLSEISRALRQLRDDGFVEFTNTGSRQRYYRATDAGYRFFRQSIK